MLLIDNDVIYNLAKLGLLVDVSAILREQHKALAALKSLAPRGKRGRLKRMIGEDGVEACRGLFKQGFQMIDEEVISPRLTQAISFDAENLNYGEMQLLQKLLNSNEDLLLTGDKRFMRGLIAAGLLDDLPQLTGRFICFEQLLLFVLKHISVDRFYQGYQAARDSGYQTDTSMVHCFEFTSGYLVGVDTINHNLRQTIAEHRTNTQTLLTTDPRYN